MICIFASGAGCAIPGFGVFHSDGEHVKYKHVAGYFSHCSLMRVPCTVATLVPFAWFALKIFNFVHSLNNKTETFHGVFHLYPCFACTLFPLLNWSERTNYKIDSVQLHFICPPSAQRFISGRRLARMCVAVCFCVSNDKVTIKSQLYVIKQSPGSLNV